MAGTPTTTQSSPSTFRTTGATESKTSVQTRRDGRRGRRRPGPAARLRGSCARPRSRAGAGCGCRRSPARRRRRQGPCRSSSPPGGWSRGHRGRSRRHARPIAVDEQMATFVYVDPGQLGSVLDGKAGAHLRRGTRLRGLTPLREFLAERMARIEDIVCSAEEVLVCSGGDLPPGEVRSEWQSIDSVADEVCNLGRRVLPIYADLSESQQIEGLVAQTVDHFGRLDILVKSGAHDRRFDAALRERRTLRRAVRDAGRRPGSAPPRCRCGWGGCWLSCAKKWPEAVVCERSAGSWC